MKRADQLRRRDQFLLVCANGRTLATVQGIEEGLTERDLVAPDLAHGFAPDPVLGLHLALARAIQVPSVPGWKASLITLWVAPGDLFEPYI